MSKRRDQIVHSANKENLVLADAHDTSLAAKPRSSFPIVGIGIADAVRKKAFEPIFTIKGAGEGTCLGLAVSYFIIVTKHGGSFDVQPQPGIGTRIIMRIPFSPDHANARTAAA